MPQMVARIRRWYMEENMRTMILTMQHDPSSTKMLEMSDNATAIGRLFDAARTTCLPPGFSKNKRLPARHEVVRNVRRFIILHRIHQSPGHQSIDAIRTAAEESRELHRRRQITLAGTRPSSTTSPRAPNGTLRGNFVLLSHFYHHADHHGPLLPPPSLWAQSHFHWVPPSGLSVLLWQHILTIHLH